MEWRNEIGVPVLPISAGEPSLAQLMSLLGRRP